MTMRDELIEAAARAIYAARYPNKVDAPKSASGTTWDDWARHVGENPGSFDGRETSRAIATAALDAILERMRDVDNDVLHAGYEAMFIDKWDGTQAPMMGAGWDAMLATLSPPPALT